MCVDAMKNLKSESVNDLLNHHDSVAIIKRNVCSINFDEKKKTKYD